MKSVVELDSNLQQRRLAELFTDPSNNPKWMDGVERIEPISGELGEPGSVYRLVAEARNAGICRYRCHPRAAD